MLAEDGLPEFKAVELPKDLPLEKKFKVHSFNNQVDRMSEEQAKHFLKECYKQLIVQEVTFQRLLAKNWGIEK